MLPKAAVVYDAGALLAADRDDDRFRVLHRLALLEDAIPVVPSPVLTQVWRGSAQQARLARALRGCLVEPTSETTARDAGALLGRSRLSDAVDAIIIATAIAADALIVTSDPDDMTLLWGMSGTRLRPAIIAV